MADYLADTNILLRSAEPAHPMHLDAVRSVKTLLARGERVCVFPQNFIEFWNVATRPADKNGLGFTTAQTDSELRRIESILTLLPDSPAVFAEWRQLVLAHSVVGKLVHDTRIVASMNVQGITNILTFNGGDFKRFTNISVTDPTNIK